MIRISIAALEAAGFSAAQIVCALKAAEAEQAARRREQNRKAQQNHRSRKQIGADSADMLTLGSPPPMVSPNTPSLTTPPPQRNIRARATRLPDDWKPTEGDLQFAWPLLPPERVAEEAAKFRDYWRARAGPNAVKIDWPATWRNWIRKAKNDQGIPPNLNGSRRSLSPWEVRQQRKEEALAELDAAIERGEPQFG